MRRALLLTASVGALLSLAACQTTPPRTGEKPNSLPAGEEEKYRALLDKYSAHQEVYAGFDTRMFVELTYQSWPFREARTRRVAEFETWPDALLQQKLADEKASFDSGYEFFMAVHMNTRTMEDFDRKNSIWRIVLVTPAGEVVPDKISRFGRSTLAMRALYPYFDDFWVGYTLHFPKTMADGNATVPPGTTQLMVRIASTVGKAELMFPAE